MSQETIWDAEYKNPKLVSGTLEPQLDFKHFIKFWRKATKQDLDGARVLDLGSGIGKHALFLAERGASVEGLEISDTAIKKAKAVTQERGYESLVTYSKQSVGVVYPFPDGYFDLVIDVLTSNSLRAGEREVYLNESVRVLKPDGWMFVKILCLDGDANARNLLEKFPTGESGMYRMPGLGLAEHVFTEPEFREFYSQFFAIKKLEKKSSYTSFEGKSYKRNFWLGYLQKQIIDPFTL